VSVVARTCVALFALGCGGAVATRSPEDREAALCHTRDGCADPDADDDRILDVDDACPYDAEVYNDVEDDDGCPDRAPVCDARDVDRSLRILTQIRFASAGVTLPDEASAILDDLATVLRDHPRLTLVAILGVVQAGEPEGSATARAAVVRDALVGRSIDAHRLVIGQSASAPSDLGAGAPRVVFEIRAVDGEPNDAEAR
jgi:outer membrane protein OmpA-like peptidoglycan-associated protein